MQVNYQAERLRYRQDNWQTNNSPMNVVDSFVAMLSFQDPLITGTVNWCNSNAYVNHTLSAEYTLDVISA